MTSTTQRRSLSAVPAWPALLAVQATLVVSLLTFGLVEAPPRALSRPDVPVEQQLRALDLPASEAAVATALQRAHSAAAVSVEAQGAVAAQLVQLGAAVELAVSGVTWGEPSAQGSVLVQPLSVSLRGHPYDLPVLLSLLERWPVDVQLLGLDAISAGGDDVSVTLRLAVSRPVGLDTAWIGERLRGAAPGVVAATPVLEQAADLARWRAYRAALAGRQETAASQTRAATRALSPVLVRLNDEGGRLSWEPGSPPRLR